MANPVPARVGPLNPLLGPRFCAGTPGRQAGHGCGKCHTRRDKYRTLPPVPPFKPCQTGPVRAGFQSCSTRLNVV